MIKEEPNHWTLKLPGLWLVIFESAKIFTFPSRRIFSLFGFCSCLFWRWEKVGVPFETLLASRSKSYHIMISYHSFWKINEINHHFSIHPHCTPRTASRKNKGHTSGVKTNPQPSRGSQRWWFVLENTNGNHIHTRFYIHLKCKIFVFSFERRGVEGSTVWRTLRESAMQSRSATGGGQRQATGQSDLTVPHEK